MNEYLRAALTRKEDDLVPDQFKPMVEQARFEQMSATDKILTKMTEWVPRAAASYAEPMARNLESVATGDTPQFAVEGISNLLGGVDQALGKGIQWAGRKPLGAAGDVMDFLINHTAEAAKRYSNGRDEDWLGHATDFMQYLVNEAAVGAKKVVEPVTAMGEQAAQLGEGLEVAGKILKPEAGMEGAVTGADGRPIPGLAQAVNTALGVEPPKKLKTLFDALAYVTPAVLGDVAEYQAAGMATAGNPILHAVHMGGVDALNAWYRGEDPHNIAKAGAGGIVTQNVVFATLNKLQRPLRALATAGWFGGKEAVGTGMDAPEGEGYDTFVDTLTNPVNLANMLTMTYLTAKSPGGKPVTELAKDAVGFVESMPANAKVFADTASVGLQNLRTGAPKDYIGWLYRAAKEVSPNATLRVFMPKQVPESTDAEGNVVPGYMGQGYISAEMMGKSVIFPMMAGDGQGPIELTLQTNGMAFRSSPEGGYHVVKGMVEPLRLSPFGALEIVRFPADTGGEKIPGTDLTTGEGTYNNLKLSNLNPWVDASGEYTGMTIAAHEARHIRMRELPPVDIARAVRDFGAESGATPEEVEAFARKIEGLTFDAEGKNKFTSDERGIFDAADEAWADAGEREYNSRAGMPSSIRNFRDFMGNTLKLMLPPEKSAIALQVQRALNSTADAYYNDLLERQQAWQVAPELFSDDATATRRVFVRDASRGRMTKQMTEWDTERASPEAELELTGSAESYTDVRPWSPDTAATALFVLPDGRIIHGTTGSGHEMTAGRMGMSVGQVIERGAIRLGGSMYGVQKGALFLEFYNRPTPEQVGTLRDISLHYMEPVKSLTIDGRNGSVWLKVAGDVGAYVDDFGVTKANSAWRKVDERLTWGKGGGRAALRPVAQALSSALEVTMLDKKVFPGKVNADTLVQTLKRYGVKDNEMKWARIPEFVALNKGQKVAPEQLRDWVYSNSVKITVNREGGTEAEARLRTRVKDRAVDLKKALAGFMHEDKIDAIVAIASSGFKDTQDAMKVMSQRNPAASPDMGRLWEQETQNRRIAANEYISAMGKLGITSTDQLKDTLGEQYAELEPTIQAAYTEGGAYNAYLDRPIGTQRPKYTEYTQLTGPRQGAGGEGMPPAVKDFVNGAVTVDIPEGKSRSFYSLEEAQKFLSEWYGQEFTYAEENIKGDHHTFTANETVGPGPTGEMGRRPTINVEASGLTGPAKFVIDSATLPSTGRVFPSHDFSRAVPGTGTIGWFRGGFIPMPDGKRAYLNAEVQGDAVQNMEDHGKKELPVPKMSIDEVRSKYAGQLKEGTVTAFVPHVERVKAITDWWNDTKVGLVSPDDYTSHLMERGEVEAGGPTGFKRVSPAKAIKRLLGWVENAWYADAPSFGGVPPQTYESYRERLRRLHARMNKISERSDKEPEPSVVASNVRDWYGQVLQLRELNNPEFFAWLEKMVPGLTKPEWAAELANMSDAETEDYFLKDSGKPSYAIGYRENNSEQYELNDTTDWDSHFIAPTKAEAEAKMERYFTSKEHSEWYANAVPDIPWSDEWRTQIWLESLRYAAETGADYYTWRSALHIHQEWGSEGHAFLPATKGERSFVMKAVSAETEVDPTTGAVRTRTATLSLPADNPWQQIENTQGRQALIEFFRAEQTKWRGIWSNRHEQGPAGEAAREEMLRMRDHPLVSERNLESYVEYIPDRMDRVAGALESATEVASSKTATQIIMENMGHQSGYVYFKPEARMKVVRMDENTRTADTTFTSPEFGSHVEAKAFIDRFHAENPDTFFRNRWAEPWTDTRSEFHYSVSKVGDAWSILRKDHEGKSEIVGTRSTEKEAVEAAAEMPKSGPVQSWEVHRLSVDRTSDPELHYQKTPDDLRKLFSRNNGDTVAKPEDANALISKPRWAQQLWKRMQANPQGGVYLPQYEGRKQNYEVVARDIMKKRIKRHGLEPVWMSTVEMEAGKPSEYRITPTVYTPEGGFDEAGFRAEIGRFGEQLGAALRADTAQGQAQVGQWEQEFRDGRPENLVAWAQANAPGSFASRTDGGRPGFNPPGVPITKHHLQIRNAEGLWDTLPIEAQQQESSAKLILEMLTASGGKNPYYTVVSNDTRLSAYTVVQYTFAEEGGTKRLSRQNYAGPYNTEIEAQNVADGMNTEAKKKVSGAERNRMVLGFPITPELRSDLLYNSRSKFKMGDVPAVTLKPATPEELAKFSDLIDPDASPDLVTEGKILGINLDKVRTSEDVKRAITATREIYETYIDTARRGRRSHEMTVAAAKALGMSVDDLLARQEGQAVNAEEMHAAFNIAVASGRVLHEMAGYLKDNPSEENSARFMQALGLHRDIQSKFAGARAEAGRSVEILKVGAAGQGQYLSSIGEALTRIPGASPERIAEMITTLPSLEQTSRFVKQMERAKTSDVLLEMWINGLLSGPKSHMANLMGNMGTTFLGPMERFMAGAAGQLSGSGGVYMGESAAMAVGFFSGLHDAFRILSHTAPWNAGDKMARQRGIDDMDITKLDYRKGAISSQKLQLTGPIGSFVDVMGRLIRSPGGAMETADQVFKLINYRMELNAQAYRTAVNEGRTGTDIVKRAREILQGDDIEQMNLLQARANEWANYQTFTNELGAAGKAVIQFSNAKWWAKMVLPFTRTPTNIFKYALDRMPALNLLQQSMRSDIMAGGVRRDMAISKIGTSAMALAAVLGLAQAGAISGAGPSDPKLRKQKEDTGWLPYAIKLGDTWYSYNRFEPIGSVLGVPATMAEMWGDLPEAEIESMALATTLAFSQAMVSKTYMKGLSDVLSAVADPGANTEKVARSYLGSLIPTVFNQVDIALFDRQIREVWTRTEALQNRIPGLSSNLPPKRDVFGHPKYYPTTLGPDILSPINKATEKSYPAMQELVRLGVGVSAAPRWMFGDRPSGMYTPSITGDDLGSGVRLDHQQYDRLSMIRGQIAEEGVLNLMKDPRYRTLSDGPEGGKADAIRRVFTQATTVARAILLKEDPMLEGKVTQRLVNRKTGKVGGADVILDAAQFGIGR